MRDGERQARQGDGRVERREREREQLIENSDIRGRGNFGWLAPIGTGSCINGGFPALVDILPTPGTVLSHQWHCFGGGREKERNLHAPGRKCHRKFVRFTTLCYCCYVLLLRMY